MGLFDIFRKKGLNLTQQMPIIMGGASIGSYKRQQSIQDSYASNADVYAIVSLLARKAASIPWYVYKKNGTKSKITLERYKALSKNVSAQNINTVLAARRKAFDDDAIVENGSVAERLMRPNPTQGQDKFFESLYTWYWLTGEGFIWGNNGGIENGEFVEMYPLPSQLMTHVVDRTDIFGVTGWRMELGNGIYLPKEQVLQWKMVNPIPQDDHIGIRGMSPLEAAYRTVMMGSEAEIAAESMMKNGGAKGALSPESVNNMVPNVSLEQAQAIKDFMGQYVNGGKNKGNITVLQTPWKYLDFGLSSVDMQLIDSQKLTLEKLCRVFGVPVVLFSPDNMADNNYQNALRDLVTNTIVPAISSLRDELNRWLVKSGDVYIDFDIQALPELQRDIEKLVQGLIGANWLTMDEKRIAMGYDPKGGEYDVAYVNSGLIPLGESSLGYDNSQADI